MKKLLLPLLIVTILVGTSFAKVTEDSVLVIPKTAVAPTIDAVLDTNIWNYVPEVLCVVPDFGDAALPDDWFDLFGSLRLMFDDTNLYLWLEVQDDIINTEGGDWQYDGVELYFDADESKGEAYDGIDDLQMRFNVGEDTPDLIDTGYGTSTGWGFDTAGIEFAIEETDLGWALEAAIPLDELQLVPDVTFGFDAQINDADETTRENMARWWSDNNDEWKNASLFGTAMLNSNRVINGETLDIPKGAAPTVDGEMGAGEWEDAVVISQNRLDTGYNIFDNVEDWMDVRSWSYLKWDDTNLYYFLKVYDDVYDYTDESGHDWDFDSIELMFDADNSKSAPYDGIDDIQIRYNLGETETDQIDAGYGDAADWGWAKENVSYVVLESEEGWNVEVAMPLADLQIEPGLEFGFEAQLNDGDDGVRTVYRWWAPSEPPWHDASMFGTANLVSGADGVASKTPAVVTNFDLSQNYPNPFNPTTSINYSVAKAGQVQLTVYDMLGKEIATLVNEAKPAGQYTVSFDGSDLSSGIYFYTLTAGAQQSTNKMMLVK